MVYEYDCTKCKKTWVENLSIDDRNKPLEGKCPCGKKEGCVQRAYSSTLTHDTKDVTSRTSNSFNDVLGSMKKHAGRGNTIRIK